MFAWNWISVNVTVVSAVPFGQENALYPGFVVILNDKLPESANNGMYVQAK